MLHPMQQQLIADAVENYKKQFIEDLVQGVTQAHLNGGLEAQQRLHGKVRHMKHGGPGSGDYGHSGRAGQVGGSGSGSLKSNQAIATKMMQQAGFTVKERNAIGEYKTSSGDINDLLRGQPLKGKYIQSYVDHLKSIPNELDSALQKSTLSKSITVYRGMPDSSHIGSIDPAYMSTSLDRDAALEFTKGYDDSAILELTAPSGTHALYTDAIKDAGESEILFGRNTKVDITGSSQVKIGEQTLTKFTGTIRSSKTNVLMVNGSSSSGDWGHEGRPGEVGGSGPGSDFKLRMSDNSYERDNQYKKVASDLSKKWNPPRSGLDKIAKEEGIDSSKMSDDELKQRLLTMSLRDWEASSGGPVATMAIKSVADDIGVPYTTRGDNSDLYKWMDSNPDVKEAASSLGHVMYKNTQEDLKEHSIDELHLYRVGSTAEDHLMSSWSTEYGGYATVDNARGRVEATIPSKYIFSTPRTGYGNPMEYEAIVLPRPAGTTKSNAQIVNGSSSSGDWGHAGRPGLVGGSASAGSEGRAPNKAIKEAPKEEPAKKITILQATPEPTEDSGEHFVKTEDQRHEAYRVLSDKMTQGYSEKSILPPDQKASLVEYTRNGYVTINHGLRNDDLSLRDQKDVDNLDKAFETAAEPIPEGITLYRGIGGKSAGKFMESVGVGDVCEDKAFQSFSYDQNTAQFFAHGQGDDKGNACIMLRTITDGSSKGIFIDRDESEMIFNRGTQWKCVGIAKQEVNELGRKSHTTYFYDMKPVHAKTNMVEMTNADDTGVEDDGSVDFDFLNQEALDFAKEYGHNLVVNGGGYVWDAKQGKEVFVPWLANSMDNLRQNIVDTISDGIDNGEGYGEIADDLSEIWDAEDSRLSTVARTEVVRAQFKGTTTRYRNAGVTQVQWLLGDRACPICSDIADENDGVYNIDECPQAPVHPNCMCAIAPVTESMNKIMVHGGPGSGDHGHEGRPGEVGGSGSGGSYKASDVESKPIDLTMTTFNGEVSRKCDNITESIKAKNLPHDQYESMLDYRSSQYHMINGYLRHGPEALDRFKTKSEAMDLLMGPNQPDVDEMTKTNIENMDKAFENAKTIPEGITLYRGIGAHTAQSFIDNTKVGDICDDKAFQSMTYNFSVADQFSHETDDGTQVILRTITDGTTKGIRVSDSSFESEIVMNRGTQWKITSIERQEGSNQRGRGMKLAIYNVAPVHAKSNAVMVNGGPGSGDFGHEGRPGQVGGSGEGKSDERLEYDAKRKQLDDDFHNGKIGVRKYRQIRAQLYSEYDKKHPGEFEEEAKRKLQEEKDQPTKVDQPKVEPTKDDAAITLPEQQPAEMDRHDWSNSNNAIKYKNNQLMSSMPNFDQYITDTQSHNAMMAYSMTLAGRYNKDLRNGDFEAGHSDWSDGIKRMDGIFDRYSKPIPEGVDLYRGLSGSHSIAASENWKEGDIINDPGFQSFSYDPSVAQDFATGAKNSEGVGFASNRGSIIHVISDGKTSGIRLDTLRQKESEVVINRGTSWKIARMSSTKVGGTTYKTYDVIPVHAKTNMVSNMWSTINQLVKMVNGGQGSGDWGHEGRPGEVGGSSTSGKNYYDVKETKEIDVDQLKKDSSAIASKVDGMTDSLDFQTIGLSDPEVLSLAGYKNYHYKWVNDYLRHGDNPGYQQYKSEVDNDLINLDKTFSNAPIIPEGITLYRGIGTETSKDFKNNMKVGDVCQDKGFQSWTYNRNSTDNFVGDAMDGYGVILKTTTDGTTSGIRLSKSGYESEMLMNRGTKWKIVDIQKEGGITDGGKGYAKYRAVYTVAPVHE